MTQLDQTPQIELGAVRDDDMSGRSQAVRPKEKSVRWVEVIVRKLRKPGQLVGYPCA